MIIGLLAVMSCKTPGEKWQNSLTKYKELKSKTMVLQLMKMEEKNDTSALAYKIRIYPAKAWEEQATPADRNHLNYQMDSCFALKTGKTAHNPAFVQPVANGVTGSFEYLVSFAIDSTVKMKPLQLIYTDKYIDGRTYTLDLTDTKN